MVLEEARRAGFLGPGPLRLQLEHALGFAAIACRLGTVAAVAGPGGPPIAGTDSPSLTGHHEGGPAAPAATIAATVAVADLGSGGGLPGLVVACTWPAAAVTLIDSSERRTTFLRRAVDRLGLGERVSVVHERAEMCGRDDKLRSAFDGVTARSFGRPAVVAECGAPLLKTGGWMLVSEPPAGRSRDRREPARWPPEPLRQLGLVPEQGVHEAFEYQVLRQAEACPERFPRRVGVPAKRPLF